MAAGQEQGFLQDKLRDQISVSIKDSLSKATAVLSSLHRVHSYLEVLKSVPSLTGCGEGVKGALEQVRAIRTDAAALLQTVYLTEIGLQSLEQVDKSTSSAGDVTIITNTVNPPPPDLPGDVITNTAINSSTRDEVMQSGTVVELPDISHTILPAPASEDSGPPAKKQNFGIVITKCIACKKKYATDQIDPQSEGMCKICHSRGTPANQTGIPTNQPPIKNLLMIPDPVLSSTPNTASPGGSKNKVRKVTATPMACKVCGTSFVYRRCLFRHLRENHPGIDLNNIHDYIETETVANEGVSLPDEGTDSQNTSMNVTVGSEILPGPSDIDGSAILLQNSLAQADEVFPAEEGEGEDGQDSMETSMKQTYTCTICSKTFDRPYRLTRHLNIHDPNRPRVSCHICDRSFTRFDTLENHVKSVHSNERPFQCQYSTCQKTYATQTALMNHLKVHTNGKPYQCQECDSSFSLLIEYKMHARQKHADTERLRCNDCYQVFPDVGSLENHRSLEHLFECEVCGKRFARLAYLQLHIKVHNGEKVYNCGVCSQGFDSEIAYRQHMRSHPKPTRGKRFHCQLCDKSFEAPNELIAHYRCEEHREKASALGLGENTTLLNTIEGGDLSDMSALVDEVAMGTTSITMETTPVTMTTTMDPKQVSLDVTPEVLSAIENRTASNIISSAITAQSASFQT